MADNETETNANTSSPALSISMTLQQTNVVTNEIKITDISNMVSDIVLENQIDGQPGKLTFNCVDDEIIYIAEGGIINFMVNGKGVFFGRVFTVSFDDGDTIKVTAYDQMRYLQCVDEYVLSGKTASQIFETICKDFKVQRYNVISPTTNIISSHVFDGKPLSEIINYGIGEELRFRNKWYMVRDNYGTLEFIDIEKLATQYVFYSNSNIFSYNFETSIDSDTYNQVKIYQEVRENKKGKQVRTGGKVVKRDFGFAKADASIDLWGTLQYCEKSNKHLNPVQLQQYADRILNNKNRETRKYTVKAEGLIDVNAGSQVYIYIGKVDQRLPDYNKFLVLASTHTFSNNEHVMELTLGIPQYGNALK